jgi:tRNA modification GTPase
MLTEATLDFPDEELDFLRADDASGKLAAIGAHVARVLAQASQGVLLREGLSVVLVGVPNVGKSSLLNQLAGDDVAIVTPIPGTTRDTVQRQIDVHGVPLTVVDTAGLRPTDDPIETLGIERTWAAVAGANLVLVIVDARDAAASIPQADRDILDRLPASLPRIVIHNKIDLATPPLESGVDVRGGERHVWLCAKSGEGVERLRHMMLDVAGAHEDMEGTFIARERHLVALTDAKMHLDAAATHLVAGEPALELFAEELREAQNALASITGEFSADDLLGVIFSRFCIGK